MFDNLNARWLDRIARPLRGLAIPQLAILVATLQFCGFLLITVEPMNIAKLPLVPELVWQGEVWRLLSFLAIPPTTSVIGFIFSTLFTYFILTSLEAAWGATRTTLYVLTSIVVTVLFSLIFDFPIASVSGLGTTLFLAAAALFPEQEINIYMVIPVKMKLLGWIALAFVVYEFLLGEWIDRLFLIAIYSNYLLFFAPTLIFRFKQWKRRRDFRSR